MASTEAAAKAVAPPAKAKAMPSAKTITWLTMCFMTVSAVASIRNTPSMAVYGLACIFLYLLPAVVFLLPTSLVAAELASGWDGGVYNWVSQGIGPRAGFIAIWTQFAMTLTYYPSLLAYVASTLAYVVHAEPRQQRRLHGRGDRDRLLGLDAGQHARRRPGGQALEQFDAARHGDPRLGARDPRRHLPVPGQPERGADRGLRAHAADRRHRRPRAHRQQLPVATPAWKSTPST